MNAYIDIYAVVCNDLYACLLIEAYKDMFPEEYEDFIKIPLPSFSYFFQNHLHFSGPWHLSASSEDIINWWHHDAKELFHYTDR